MAIPISIPRGTRDFGPAESLKREYILQTLQKVFLSYGFVPIQTPAMENLETLTGKYGEEGEQLLFKVLNSGLHEQKNKEKLLDKFKIMLDKPYHTPDITDKALRYDLTVPFARYVSMHRQQLAFPFRRYQIQPVWRADRPQKGRYREFVQCDVDIIGTNSLISEWELICLINDAFRILKIPAVLKWNHRKLLYALAEIAQCSDRFSEITLCLDKWDKKGKEGVEEELIKRNFSSQTIKKVLEGIVWLQENHLILTENKRNGNGLHEMFDTQAGKDALNDIVYIYSLIKQFPQNHIFISPDFTLARGLNYYTGFIFEAKCSEGTFQPSILGGGRYDDLTGIFRQPGLSGVGVSFGLDRIYDVMEELKVFPPALQEIHTAFCLGLYLGEESISYLHPVLQTLRNKQIPCFQFPESRKMARQIEYAEKNGIPYVLIAGTDEMVKQGVQIKDIRSGSQQFYSKEEAVKIISDAYEHFQS